MSACLHERAERFVPKTGHGEVIPGVWHRCADCGEAMYRSFHPSLCAGCGHGNASHDFSGCWASVRSAEDIHRCDCLGDSLWGKPE